MLKVKCFQFNPIQENTYLLYNEFNECLVIDPGCYFDAEKDTLAAWISDHKLLPKLLLNTHCHLDHVFGNAFVAQKYDLLLQMHKLEKPVLDFAPTSGLMYDMPFDNYTGEIKYFAEGTKILLGKDELDILFTPGHSPGSVSFYSKEAGFVISGDALFQRSIGRTDLPGGNLDQLINAIKTKLFTLPDNTVVYSGHGAPTTIGEEKKGNPFLQ